MTNGADDHAGDHSSADAFALVGNEIRAAILRAFGDARLEERSMPTLSFSDIRDRADLDVDSGQFNYHLQQLVGHYLERRDEGYRMRPEGRLLYQTLRAGTFDPDDSRATIDAGFACYYCATDVQATFGEGTARVQCPGCEYLYDIAAVPPGSFVDGEPDLSRVSEYNYQQHFSFARGVCPTCGNAVTTDVLDPSAVPFPGAEKHEIYVYRSCDHCGAQIYLSIGESLLPDPGLISFCYDHGVDVLSTPLWELKFAATDRHVTVQSSEPWSFVLEVPMEDETLELLVNETISVEERHRRHR